MVSQMQVAPHGPLPPRLPPPRFQSIILVEPSDSQPLTRCEWCLKRCCSHRVIWFCILVPVYIILLVVTAMVSTMATKTEEGTAKSFADIFFGITYFFLLSASLLLLLRYLCVKCDRAVCTCPDRQVYNRYDGQLLYPAKKPCPAPCMPRRQQFLDMEGNHQNLEDHLHESLLRSHETNTRFL